LPFKASEIESKILSLLGARKWVKIMVMKLMLQN
jgi:hypothetical protein